jgi:hypothetical protein
VVGDICVQVCGRGVGGLSLLISIRQSQPTEIIGNFHRLTLLNKNYLSFLGFLKDEEI